MSTKSEIRIREEDIDSHDDVHEPPKKQRKRAMYSCDTCKKRKRACKRYDDLGKRAFDNTTSCEQCKKMGIKCVTTIARKKRTFYSVSENSLIQLKCLTKIVKAMFPECDPNNFKDIKNIAKELFVELPTDKIDIDKLNENKTFVEDSLSQKETVSDNNDNDDNDDDDNDNDDEYTPDVSYTPVNTKEVDENGHLRNHDLRHLQIGLGGAERLFTVLLEVENRHSQTGAPKLDVNNSLTSVTRQRTQSTFHPSYVINGNDIQKFLLLDGIPQKECEFYTDIFFTKIHDRYFVFNESKYRARQENFFKILYNKNHDKIKDISKTGFTNEEICTMYLVWILGRKSYLLRLQKNEKFENKLETFASELTISDYLNAVNLCLSCCFFTNNIHTIRMLYLTSLFHSTIKNRNTAWHLMANTCIKCFGLGYHRAYPVARLPADEQDDVKLIFWSCLKLHINNCIVMGRLPNISIYEVDLDPPALEYIKDDLVRSAYKSSTELFRIMFSVLKNREQIIKTKNPWLKENFNEIIQIKNQLLVWSKTLHPQIKDFKKVGNKLYVVKLHMQYYHCLIAMTVPYLIAYSLYPNKLLTSNIEIVKTLCLGIKSSIDIIDVICVASEMCDLNGLLYYDLFYAYNSLMMLLLACRLIKGVENDHEEGSVFKGVLLDDYKIDVQVIMKTIYDIKDINTKFGSTATSVMKDASNNITLLLKHFKIEDQNPHLNSVKNTVDPSSPNILNEPQRFSVVNSPSGSFTDDFINPNSPSFKLDNEFFNVIQSINTEVQPKPLDLNDKFFWDWNQLFSMDE